jgi:hypothetical protein
MKFLDESEKLLGNILHKDERIKEYLVKLYKVDEPDQKLFDSYKIFLTVVP